MYPVGQECCPTVPNRVGSPEGPLGPAGVLVPYTAGWNPACKLTIDLTEDCVCRQRKVRNTMPAGSLNRDVFMVCAPGVFAPEGWLGL